MDLNAVAEFLGRFQIRDRDSHKKIPFKLNVNQRKIHEVALKQQEAGQPIRIIVDKARRVGVSSWTEGLLFAHCCGLPSAHALIAAHEFKSSKALFSIPKDFAKQAFFLNLRDVEREITFPHETGDSLLQIITAGKDTSGRGFTLSALHLSEAAHLKSAEPYTSIIPAVSNHKNTIIVIESTPNGMDGDGETFYEMWLDAVEHRSEYEAVFLTWLDDPACAADPSIAKNAPVDKEEKELLKMGVTKAQLAWRRLKIASPECGGLVELFHQEFPTTWQESFITSGFPAFEEVERQWALRTVKKPKWQGFIDSTEDGSLKLRQHHKGDLCIWEDPIEGHYYYIGADAARGDDEKDGRDFAANVGFDGNTGHQVFRYAGYVVPEIHGCYLNSLGRHYNRAMLNGELTGGYGYNTLYVVRDLLHYPNLYRWKGKDDKIGSWASGSKAVWFETTSHTRTILFESMRAGLREGAGTNGEYGITVCDEMLAAQIRMCTRRETGRIDVKKGHDDVLFGCCPPDAQVETPSGRVSISTLQPGDTVRSAMGKFQRIVATSKRPVNDGLLRIKALGSFRQLKLTANHRVLCSRYEWRKRKTKTRKKILLHGPEWKPACLLEVGDYLLAPKRKNLNQPSFTEEQLYVMGWYLAEGCICRGNDISFALHKNESPVAQKLSEILMKYDPPVPKTVSRFLPWLNKYADRKYRRKPPRFRVSKGNGWELTYCSDFWASLLSQHCGKLAENKRLSSCLYNCSGLLPLVQAYIDGDGSRTRSCEREHLAVSSKSETLIWQIRQILLDEGIWSTVSRPSKQDICVLHMTPEYFSKLGRMEKYKPFVRLFEKRYVVETNEGFWVAIKSIEEIPYDGDVFNLEVAEDETFQSDGYAVHNSMLANVAMRQYAPPRTMNPVKTHEKEEDAEVRGKIGMRGDAIVDDTDHMLARHYEKVMDSIKNYQSGEDYEEVGGA